MKKKIRGNSPFKLETLWLHDEECMGRVKRRGVDNWGKGLAMQNCKCKT